MRISLGVIRDYENVAKCDYENIAKCNRWLWSAIGDYENVAKCSMRLWEYWDVKYVIMRIC